MKSTIGRPRVLTDRQVKIILAWRVRYLVWRALGTMLKSQRQLARELGVSQSTVARAVRLFGNYKVGPAKPGDRRTKNRAVAPR
jgi:transposase